MGIRAYMKEHWASTVKTPDMARKGIVRMPTEYTVPCMREYETPSMMGWTAGVYAFLTEDGL